MLVAGQRMANQNGIGFIGIQSAIGLVGDGQGREADAGIHHQGPVSRQAQHKTVRRIDFAPRGLTRLQRINLCHRP